MSFCRSASFGHILDLDRSFFAHGRDNCHQKLISCIKFALNLFSKVTIWETNVVTYFAIIVHQTKKAFIYINELGEKEEEERRGEGEKWEGRKEGGERRGGGEEGRREGGKERREERGEERGGEKEKRKEREGGKREEGREGRGGEEGRREREEGREEVEIINNKVYTRNTRFLVWSLTVTLSGAQSANELLGMFHS